MIPTLQTKIVLVTYAIDRARAFMCFVTVTPDMLNVAIENTPNMQNTSNEPLLPAYLKYEAVFSKKGNPWESKTQAFTPKWHGIKLMMRIIIE